MNDTSILPLYKKLYVHIACNDKNGNATNRVTRIEITSIDNLWSADLEGPGTVFEERGWPLRYGGDAFHLDYRDRSVAIPYVHYRPRAGNIMWDRASVKREYVVRLLQFLRDSGEWMLMEAPTPLWQWWNELHLIEKHTKEGRLVF